MYRTKRGSSKLKQHEAAIHSIDIVWHDCPELGCEYRATQKGNVKAHKADMHDIRATSTWHE